MNIICIPIFADNYVFLWHDPATHRAMVVDPGQAAPVLEMLDVLQAQLLGIVNTHHHWDHVDGNPHLLAAFPGIPVYGGEGDRGRIPGQTHYLQDGDEVEFLGRQATVFAVPGHTLGHIAYYFAPTPVYPNGELFCGDTLFAGGCGRLFEGTPAQMMASLNRLRDLPPDTRVWCTHEYTQKNLEFALSVDTDNDVLKQRYQSVLRARAQDIATVPTTIALERQTNPFFRYQNAALMAQTHSRTFLESFTLLRSMKDRF